MVSRVLKGLAILSIRTGTARLADSTGILASRRISTMSIGDVVEAGVAAAMPSDTAACETGAPRKKAKLSDEANTPSAADAPTSTDEPAAQIEAADAEEGALKLPKHKVAMLLGYCGTGYQGLQSYVLPLICTCGLFIHTNITQFTIAIRMQRPWKATCSRHSQKLELFQRTIPMIRKR